MVVDLQESRKRIDEIDRQIVELFEKRMDVAANVADYKIATGKAVFDKEREEQKIDTLRHLAHSDFNNKCVAELFTQIMAMSRKFQYSKLEMRKSDSRLEPYDIVDDIRRDNIKVVYQGVPGAYSHEAMLNFFGNDVRNINVDTFREAMEAVSDGVADYVNTPKAETISLFCLSSFFSFWQSPFHCIKYHSFPFTCLPKILNKTHFPSHQPSAKSSKHCGVPPMKALCLFRHHYQHRYYVSTNMPEAIFSL